CRKNRIPIIREFRSLMEAVLSPESESRVILADADLSDYSVNFIRGIGQQPHLEPWLALSHWQAGGYDCCSYERPEDLLMRAEAAIERGEKILVMTDSQKAKGRFSTTALAARWQQMYLDKRILVLDSKTLHRKDHPAYGAIASGKLEELLSQYDIVICSPSVETGISIDLKGHFDAVYGFYAGVLSENSIRQSLLRLRERVPRHIYIAPHGLESIGGGETWYKALAETQEKCARATLNLLYEAGCDDIESNLSQAATVAWAKMAARHNTGSAALRECVLQGLRDEGHSVTEVTDTDDDARQELKAELKAEKHDRLRERAQAVCEATSVDASELEALEQSRSVESLAQELALQKAQLQKRYQLEAITPDLYILDQVGYGAKLRLHYYLTVGREYLKNRDRTKVNELLKNSDGAIWAPDVNRATLITKIATYEYFNVLDILDLDELSEHTPQVRALGEAVQGQIANIRVASGINLYGTTKPDGSIDYIEIVRRFLKPLGFNLPLCRREGPRGEQVRIYQLEQVDYKTFKLEGEAVTYQVNRHEIYQRWLEKDAIAEKQPETPAIERTEAVVSDKSVVSQGNNKFLISPGDYQALSENSAPESPPNLNQIERVCLEVL
ncbi:plasmid replication protein, CyRepA1 family, partial [Sphaerothrix gracilis]|uniref:plasmid replication protein, CyRepA1 family n=1 Tax=Sphaerothrix gracilis TaxID=3151835 RepID=UPI0031FD35D5